MATDSTIDDPAMSDSMMNNLMINDLTTSDLKTSDSEKIIDRFPAGTVKIPPSKSLGHRALICAALAGGEAAGANVDDPGDSEDIRATRVGIAQIAAVLAGG
ncbi:MAG: hypothetical protein FWF33_06635, partial [Clostridiales bacterium]|nr:hypothetical protein [Clostridiales bacterium]